MKSNQIDPAILLAASQVTGKRAKAVIDFIIKNGVVTTDDLEKMGYIHPPRAVRDVRENGIPIETVRIKSKSGKSIAAYKFGDPSLIQGFKLGGRKTFPKDFKTALYLKQNGKCAICDENYDPLFFQIDHRIPYEFMGDDQDKLKIENFMLLCASCNRMKARATETQCAITCFKSGDINIIKSCFWASPENYKHVCMKQIRATEIVWQGEEVNLYETLQSKAKNEQTSISELIKKIIADVIG